MPGIDTNTIVTAILSSGLISGLVSGIINYISNNKLKVKEFELEYKKLLLGKKVKGYEDIVSMVSEIVLGYRVYPSEYAVLSEPCSVKRFFIMKDPNEKNDPFSVFHRDIFESAMPNWFWYTSDFRSKLNELFGLLTKIKKEIISIEEKDKKRINSGDLILIGSKYNKELDDLGFSLLKIIRDDYPKLHILK